MRIELPSAGKFGVFSVEMRSPKIGDLRHVSELSDVESIAKTDFVKSLMKEPQDLDNVSIYDRDYLFLLAAAAVNMNSFDFSVRCECGNTINDSFDISDVDVETLSADVQIKVDKQIDGVNYQFHLPTVKEEQQAVQWVLTEDAAYNDKTVFSNRNQDAMVAVVLGKEVNNETVQWVRDLDLKIYFAALFFIQCEAHGVQPVKVTECPKCHKKTMTIIPVVKSLTQVTTEDIMRKFMRVSGDMSFEAFCDLTVPEFETLLAVKE